jgi:uncharacterized RDD family membrane protein YckC
MNTKPAEKSLRLMNFIIDTILITLITIPFSILLSIGLNAFNSQVLIYISFYIVQFFYYFIFELTSGQTIGKKITKTKVIPVKGKLNMLKVLLRTLCRLIIFDQYSYIFGHITGIHDQYSATYVVKV